MADTLRHVLYDLLRFTSEWGEKYNSKIYIAIFPQTPAQAAAEQEAQRRRQNCRTNLLQAAEKAGVELATNGYLALAQQVFAATEKFRQGEGNFDVAFTSSLLAMLRMLLIGVAPQLHDDKGSPTRCLRAETVSPPIDILPQHSQPTKVQLTPTEERALKHYYSAVAALAQHDRLEPTIKIIFDWLVTEDIYSPDDFDAFKKALGRARQKLRKLGAVGEPRSAVGIEHFGKMCRDE